MVMPSPATLPQSLFETPMTCMEADANRIESAVGIKLMFCTLGRMIRLRLRYSGSG